MKYSENVQELDQTAIFQYKHVDTSKSLTSSVQQLLLSAWYWLNDLSPKSPKRTYERLQTFVMLRSAAEHSNERDECATFTVVAGWCTMVDGICWLDASHNNVEISIFSTSICFHRFMVRFCMYLVKISAVSQKGRTIRNDSLRSPVFVGTALYYVLLFLL